MNGSDDVHQTVEYRRDKWTMRRVPLALLLCLAGMTLLIHVAPGLPHPGVLVIFTAILAAWVVGHMLFVLVFDGSTAGHRWLAVGLFILAVVALAALVA